jgi:hypothetical protein
MEFALEALAQHNSTQSACGHMAKRQNKREILENFRRNERMLVKRKIKANSLVFNKGCHEQTPSIN